MRDNRVLERNTNKNTKSIEIKDVNKLKAVMSKCRMENNIVKCMVLSRNETKRIEDQSRNVIVISMFGKKANITKAELMSNFTGTDGSPIKLKYISRGKWYYFMQKSGKEVMAFAVPKGYSIEFGGRNIKSGVILYDNENDVFSVLSKRVFKKSCRVIEACKEPSKIVYMNDRVSRSIDAEIDNIVDRRTLINRDRRVENNIGRANTAPVAKKHILNITARLFNVDDKLIGYVIQDETGRRKMVPLAKVMGMAEKGMIRNVEVVRHPGGKKFLRGNGVRLESLEKVIK